MRKYKTSLRLLALTWVFLRSARWLPGHKSASKVRILRSRPSKGTIQTGATAGVPVATAGVGVPAEEAAAAGEAVGEAVGAAAMSAPQVVAGRSLFLLRDIHRDQSVRVRGRHGLALKLKRTCGLTPVPCLMKL